MSGAPLVMLAVTALGDLAGRVRSPGPVPGPGTWWPSLARWVARPRAWPCCQAGLAGPASLLAAHRWPQPDYAAGPEAAVLGATSMIDISDGLVQDLGHVAAASGVQISLESARLPGHDSLRDAAEALGGQDPLGWILSGGETCSGRDIPAGHGAARALGRDRAGGQGPGGTGGFTATGEDVGVASFSLSMAGPGLISPNLPGSAAAGR